MWFFGLLKNYHSKIEQKNTKITFLKIKKNYPTSWNNKKYGALKIVTSKQIVESSWLKIIRKRTIVDGK